MISFLVFAAPYSPLSGPPWAEQNQTRFHPTSLFPTHQAAGSLAAAADWCMLKIIIDLPGSPGFVKA
jgi:hypothetical protein